jgi:Uma2 family endonuclease
MAEPARRIATYEDVLDAPANLVAEVIGGELRLQPRPAKPHVRAAGRLASRLDGPFDLGEGGPGGWLILFEPELHLGPDILVPDLAGWRRERMPEIGTEEPYFVLPPDWVCEVLSPGTYATDRADKLPIFARERVSHAWLVEPVQRTLEILRLEKGGHWLLVGTWRGAVQVRAEPFDAVELDLSLLWADVRLG